MSGSFTTYEQRLVFREIPDSTKGGSVIIAFSMPQSISLGLFIQTHE
jgi:hypothetical protein